MKGQLLESNCRRASQGALLVRVLFPPRFGLLVPLPSSSSVVVCAAPEPRLATPTHSCCPDAFVYGPQMLRETGFNAGHLFGDFFHVFIWPVMRNAPKGFSMPSGGRESQFSTSVLFIHMEPSLFFGARKKGFIPASL